MHMIAIVNERPKMSALNRCLHRGYVRLPMLAGRLFIYLDGDRQWR